MTDEEKQQQEKLDQEARSRAEQETFELLTTHKDGEEQGKGKQTGAQHEHIERGGPRHHAGVTPPEAKHGRSPADRAQGRAQEADRAGEKTAPSEMKDWASKGKEKEEQLAQTQTQSKTAGQGQPQQNKADETHQQRR